jgi:protein ImuB
MKRSSGSNSTSAKNPEAKIQHILVILHKWGIHTLGQLAALDKEQLSVRLGPEAVRMWECANGQSNRLLKLVRPPESFEENFEFEKEIETAEPLLFMLRRFLEQLSLRLSAIYLVAKELTLRITLADKRIYERILKIPQPTNDIELLFRMLHTHLENFKSEHPIIAVALTAQPTKPGNQQFGLFETTLRSPHQLSETLARLTALLGTDRVGTPVVEDTHRPDAFRLEPFMWHGLPAHPIGRMPMPRPALRRFRPALSVSVFLDDDRPAHVHSADFRGKSVDHRGPYFLSGNWWDEKSWKRAEWDLQLENGELVRAHEAPSSSNYGATGEGSWKVDGIYD